MGRRFGKLPPLSSLRGFEASARLKSFSLASEELNITQSAVSHQIKALEEALGLALFNRVGRSVELTVAGMDFLATVSEALELLARGKRRMSFYYRPGSVVIGTTPAFASKWLLPRFERLTQDIDGVQPWLYTEDEQYDLKAQEVDLAIWFGGGEWPGLETEKLFHDYLTPMLAPSLAQSLSSPTEIIDLAGQNRIHDERTEDWQAWLAQVGHLELDDIRGFKFSDSALALDYAAHGTGVVLGSKVLAEGMLDADQIKAPFPECLKTNNAYYLVRPVEQEMRPSVAATHAWLVEQARMFRQGLG
ncbi:MAG: LysR substrate-binding domain-containing protein [Pseudomonadota bacterium]